MSVSSIERGSLRPVHATHGADYVERRRLLAYWGRGCHWGQLLRADIASDDIEYLDLLIV